MKEISDSLKQSKVLIVDDTEFNRLVIKEILSVNGFDNIKLANDGSEALDITKEWHPQLVLLDMMLPIIDGYEYCRRVRRSPQFDNMIILVQTALTDPEKRAEAFREGATDLITKPINADELISRAIVHLEKNALLNDLREYQLKMEEELDAAREMQNTILPSEEVKNAIEKKYRVETGDYFKPSLEVGGDFWGMRELSSSEFSIYNVDLSGHGVTAALNTFRVHTLIDDIEKQIALNPAELVSFLNFKLIDLLSTEQFATMFYGVVDVEKNILRYSYASSPPPVIITEKGIPAKLVSEQSFPLGVERRASYENKELPFRKGGVLMLYSDALTETGNDDGIFLAEESLITIFQDFVDGGLGAKEITENVVNEFYNYIGTLSNLTDDLTINMIQKL